MKYAVRFYKDDEFLAVGYGEAKDEYEAETNAEFWMICNRPDSGYNRIEVTEGEER